jgi:hypothetical protein
MIDPNDTDFEVVDTYDDPTADTIVIYDSDGDQHVVVKDD